jgi:hypothetical protein
MATNTYVALDTKTLTSATTSVVFNSIPQTYTDLVLISNTKNASGLDGGITLQFNTDTSPSGTNYSATFFYGDGSSAIASRHANYPFMVAGRSNASNWGNGITHIMNYANTTTNKTVISRGNSDGLVIAYVGLWRATPQAITTITIGNEAGANFVVGSTFTLYGIANSNIGAPKAFGGTITQDATYTYHTFGASGTFAPQQSLTADVLVIAGGGGSGRTGGGGGAGGLRGLTSQSMTTTAYTITVGSGGSGATADGTNATNGINSSIAGSGFTTITASGGGGGSSYNNSGTSIGSSGGSGGGGGTGDGNSYSRTGGAGNSGSYSPVEGFAGGNGVNSRGSGGGGGATAVGSNAPSTNNGGAGGAGSSAYSSWGSTTGTGQNSSGTYYYAGGGGGSGLSANGAGGLGGGGTGNNVGTVNTGGGAGGANNLNGAAGGSGIVIIRYAN